MLGIFQCVILLTLLGMAFVMIIIIFWLAIMMVEIVVLASKEYIVWHVFVKMNTPIIP